jgi:hypothetical protein
MQNPMGSSSGSWSSHAIATSADSVPISRQNASYADLSAERVVRCELVVQARIARILDGTHRRACRHGEISLC